MRAVTYIKTIGLRDGLLNPTIDPPQHQELTCNPPNPLKSFWQSHSGSPWQRWPFIGLTYSLSKENATMPQSLDIEAYGIPMRVYFDYEPAEPAVWSGPQAGPGCESQAVIERVFVGGVDIYDMLNNKQLQRIEEILIRIIED